MYILPVSLLSWIRAPRSFWIFSQDLPQSSASSHLFTATSPQLLSRPPPKAPRRLEKTFLVKSLPVLFSWKKSPSSGALLPSTQLSLRLWLLTTSPRIQWINSLDVEFDLSRGGVWVEGRLHPDNALLPPPGIWLKRKHAYICLAVIWAYAAFWTTMPLVGLGDYAPEPFGTSCTLDWWLAQASVGGQIFILNILFFCLLLPTAVIVFSYVKIIAKVKSSSKEVAHFDSRIHSSHVLEVKLTKVTAVIIYRHVL